MIPHLEASKKVIRDELLGASMTRVPLEEWVDFLEQVSGEVEVMLDAAREDVIRNEKQVEHPGRL